MKNKKGSYAFRKWSLSLFVLGWGLFFSGLSYAVIEKAPPRITSPQPGIDIAGNVEIRGINVEKFNSYRLKYVRLIDKQTNIITQAPATNNQLLGTWDTTLCRNGQYQLVLDVFTEGQSDTPAYSASIEVSVYNSVAGFELPRDKAVVQGGNVQIRYTINPLFFEGYKLLYVPKQGRPNLLREVTKGTLGNDTTYDFSWDTTGDPDGEGQLVLELSCNEKGREVLKNLYGIVLGNNQPYSSSIDISIKNIEVEIALPQPDTIIAGSVNVEMRGYGLLKSYLLRCVSKNGRVYKTIGNSSEGLGQYSTDILGGWNIQYPWRTTETPDGRYTLIFEIFNNPKDPREVTAAYSIEVSVANATKIISPLNKSTVKGVLPISGTAYCRDFASYKLFCESEDGQVLKLIGSGNKEVFRDKLCDLDTTELPEGRYRVSLGVFKSSNKEDPVATDSIYITVDNFSAALSLLDIDQSRELTAEERNSIKGRVKIWWYVGQLYANCRIWWVPEAGPKQGISSLRKADESFSGGYLDWDTTRFLDGKGKLLLEVFSDASNNKPIDTASLGIILKNTEKTAAKIDRPRKEQFVHERETIIGKATWESNKPYSCRLRYEPDESNISRDANTFFTSSIPLDDGNLGLWDTRATGDPNRDDLADGKYRLILEIFDPTKQNQPVVNEYSTLVNVDNINDAPEFINLINRGVSVGSELKFRVEAKDPDDPDTLWGQLSYSAEGLPSGARFEFNKEDKAYIFSWTPRDIDKAKAYKVSFTVKDDGGLSITKAITITALYIEEIQVTDDPDSKGAPAIYKDKIIWLDTYLSGVFMYDLTKGIDTVRKIQITNNNGIGWGNAAIYENKIVWGQSHELHIYDMAGPEENKETIITLPPYHSFKYGPPPYSFSTYNTGSPVIYDGNIVWSHSETINIPMYSDFTGSTFYSGIYRYNINEKRLSEIIGSEGGELYSLPCIYQGRVALSEYRMDGHSVIIYDLSNPSKPIRLDAKNGALSVAIYEGKILWMGFDPREEMFHLYLCDIDSKEKEIKLIDKIPEGSGSQYSSAIYKDRIVYVSEENGNPDIYMYNLTTGAKIQITSDPKKQYHPAIYGDIIVWLDERNKSAAGENQNKADIYMARIWSLPKVYSVKSSPASAGQVISIEGRNFGYSRHESSNVEFPGAGFAQIREWTDNKITCLVPLKAKVGKSQLTVTTPGGSVSKDITIGESKPNKSPVSQLFSVETKEDITKPITLIATDEDGDELSYSIAAQPAHGSLSAVKGASVSYTPALNYNGADSFTFKANDGRENSNIARVEINVTAVNDPPTIIVLDINDNNVGDKVTIEEAKALEFKISATDPDDPASSLSYTYSASPELPKEEGKKAKFGLNPDTGKISFTWVPDYEQSTRNKEAAYNLSFSVTDGHEGGTDTKVIGLAVKNTNRSPIPNSQSVTTAEDTNKVITLSATDPDQDPLVYTILSQPAHAELGGVAPAIVYKPALNYNNTLDSLDSFIFQAYDGEAASAASIKIRVTPVNDSPKFDPTIGNKSIDGEKLLSFSLAAVDIDEDALTYSATGLPEGAVFKGRVFNWMPMRGQRGSYQVSFKVEDGKGGEAAETVSLTVKDVNQPPVITKITDQTVSEGKPLNFTISVSDPDAQDTLVIKLNNAPDGSTFVNKAFNWTPTYTQSGGYLLTLSVSDGQLEARQDFYLTVLDAPAPQLPEESKPKLGEEKAKPKPGEEKPKEVIQTGGTLIIVQPPVTPAAAQVAPGTPARTEGTSAILAPVGLPQPQEGLVQKKPVETILPSRLPEDKDRVPEAGIEERPASLQAATINFMANYHKNGSLKEISVLDSHAELISNYQIKPGRSKFLVTLLRNDKSEVRLFLDRKRKTVKKLKVKPAKGAQEKEIRDQLKGIISLMGYELR